MSNLPKKGPGRPPGMPNKATADARQAIAAFVDGNAHRLTEWLDRVAEGVKVTEQTEDGEIIEKYVVTPNPAKAFDMFQSVVEYHVPKLARMEVAGDAENPLKTQVDVSIFDKIIETMEAQRRAKANE